METRTRHQRAVVSLSSPPSALSEGSLDGLLCQHLGGLHLLWWVRWYLGERLGLPHRQLRHVVPLHQLHQWVR